MLLSSTKNSICILAGVLSIQSITFIVLSLVDQFTPVYLKSHEFSVTWDWNFDIWWLVGWINGDWVKQLEFLFVVIELANFLFWLHI